LTAVVITVRDDHPCVLTLSAGPSGAIALPSGPLQPGHRTLQAGLRSWVEAQTRRSLGYVEQLYTFGDRSGGDRSGGDRPDIPVNEASQDASRRISIAYLALVRTEEAHQPTPGRWRRWYDLLPWEDRRHGEPPPQRMLSERLQDWARETQRPADPDDWERLGLTFGLHGAPWDDERALERYELMYEAALVPEAWLDRGLQPPPQVVALPGTPMFADHRRIVATAVSRLRAKIKYRPVLFELMPARFTLLQLQRTAEALSGVPLHKQNFRRLVAQQGLVEETGELATATGGRPARLMRFRKQVTVERPAPGIRLRATRRGGYP
ncbi:MAG: hypothetical protein EA406_03860, partial [Rhodospirillales bacterium]